MDFGNLQFDLSGIFGAEEEVEEVMREVGEFGEDEEETEEETNDSEFEVADEQFDLLGNKIAPSSLVNTGTTNDKKSSKNNKNNKKKEEKKVKEEPKYNGPRRVKLYGNLMYVEEDPNVPNEEIRQKLVEEFDCTELRKDVTVFDLDTETGVLDVGKVFHRKG